MRRAEGQSFARKAQLAATGLLHRAVNCPSSISNTLHEKRKAECAMTVEQHLFQIIPCPVDLSSPHTHLVVSGRGVPHEPLTRFYEELQKRCEAETLQANMSLLLSFFSFLEEQKSLCE